MEPEVKELLEKGLALNEENNKILKKMLLSQRLSTIFTIVKWLVIIGSILGVTYWLGPKLQIILNNLQMENIFDNYKSLLK